MKQSIQKFVMKIVSRLTPPCEIITQKVSESLDRKLSVRERAQVRIHLMYCKFCKRYQVQLLAIHNALQQKRKKDETVSAAGNLSAAAREKMKRALRENAPPPE